MKIGTLFQKGGSMKILRETGIYFHAPSISQQVDYNELKRFLEAREENYYVFNSDDTPYTSIDSLKQKLKSHFFSVILVVSNKPELIAMAFRHVLDILDKTGVEVIPMNLRHLDSSHNLTTESLKTEISIVLKGKKKNTYYHPKKMIYKKTLIIGAGIAGIQAALEIANSGNKVILIEKTGTIGGHMALFDKTFPTLDCAACILTPKMASAGQHPNIEILTLSEVSGVHGEMGNFNVQILKNPRRVNEKTCIGCGTCAERCPGRAQSDFDAKTTLRKAIYMPFPQAVPNKHLIDPESCLYVQQGKCKVCVKACPVENCINLDEEPKIVEYQVGNIIVATGFEIFDASAIKRLGYGIYPNVVTSLELERLVNSSGPTGGNIRTRTKDKKGNWIFDIDNAEPKSFALIHCVGSRDENYQKYCSRVCCMYSLKLSHLIKEKIPGAQVFEHFIDMRAYGKGYEEFYERIKYEGINFIRGKVGEIEEKENKLIVKSEDIERGKYLEYPVDMVVLSVGMKPASMNAHLAKQLGIDQDTAGWMQESQYILNSCETNRPGIYIAGTCQGPKDIPDSVAQASGAAATVIRTILSNQAVTGKHEPIST